MVEMALKNLKSAFLNSETKHKTGIHEKTFKSTVFLATQESSISAWLIGLLRFPNLFPFNTITY